MTDRDREETIFAQLLQLPTGQRMARLNEACHGDAELRERLWELLQLHEVGGDFMQVPVVSPAELAPTVQSSAFEKPGDRIGRYKLLEQIGEGGCGVVYVAEQETPLRRRVALKLIKLGMDTRQVVARFEAERQALALMDHPNIARVLDGGATETGRPFFVMELVRGIKITDYCDQNHLTTGERLALFTQVCHAVQHAHQKGIIHRDLKPSNILVTINDGQAVPKVIDFGIAKATQGRLTDQTIYTAFEQFIGTPAYVSPEQAGMTSLDIDTRADIYSLGVLLYELLTGRTPFEAKDLLAAGMEAMRRTIREKEPPKPSTRLSTMRASDLTTVAQHRRAEAPKLIHTVKGDLDWIVMKALEKDRTRRYETANGLAEDVQRHLNYEPIIARPARKLYEFQKTVRRHRFGFTAAAAVMLALMVGALVSTWQAVRATKAEQEQAKLRQAAERARNQEATERARAESNEQKARVSAAKSEQVALFLEKMLKAAGPGVARGRDATLLREILEQSKQNIEKDLRGLPEVQGYLYFIIGTIYLDIDAPKLAVANLEQAVESYRKAFDRPHPKLATALSYLGSAQARDYDLVRGKRNALDGVAMARTLDDPEVLAACLSRAARSFDPWFLADDAIPLLREAISLRKTLGTNAANSISLAKCMRDLASSDSAGTPSERLQMLRDALVLFRDHLGNTHPDTAGALYGLGQQLLDNGNFEEAAAALTETIDAFNKIYGHNYVHVILASRFLAEALIQQGRWDEAERLASGSGQWDLLGRIKAYHRDWDGALPHFTQGANHGLMALMYQKLGRSEDYLSSRHDFLTRCVPRGDFGDELSARPFLLQPVTGPDRDLVRQFATLSVPTNTPLWLGPKYCLAKALAQYRVGLFQEALQSARIAITPGTRPSELRQAWFIQAMALAQLGDKELAKSAARNAEAVTEAGPGGAPPDFLWKWPEWMIAECLGEEARQLL